MTVNEAINKVQTDCPDPYAKVYANAAMDATLYGTEGLVVQVLCILSNTQYWRGDTAREVKKVLKAYAKRKSNEEL